MTHNELEICLDMALARFEFLWARPITPMEFDQLLMMLELTDMVGDLQSIADQCVADMESLEDVGQDYFAAREFDEGLMELLQST